MNRFLVAGLATLMAGAAVAAEPPLQVSYPGDATMDCAGIAAESARMDQVMFDANQQITKAEGGAKGAGMASSIAVEGMLRTGVLGRAPGLGMFANNAAAMARQRAEAVKQQAAETIQTANTRKAMLAGLYAGKSCNAPPPAAAPAPMPEPEPAPAGA